MSTNRSSQSLKVSRRARRRRVSRVSSRLNFCAFARTVPNPKLSSGHLGSGLLVVVTFNFELCVQESPSSVSRDATIYPNNPRDSFSPTHPLPSASFVRSRTHVYVRALPGVPGAHVSLASASSIVGVVVLTRRVVVRRLRWAASSSIHPSTFHPSNTSISSTRSRSVGADATGSVTETIDESDARSHPVLHPTDRLDGLAGKIRGGSENDQS